jgi:phosphoglycolate phosphatase
MTERFRTSRTLIFDLDGTLSDPAVGIGRSINFALAAYGYDLISDSAVSQYIGPQLDQSFRSITGEQSAGAIAQLVAKYRERYSEIGYSENALYPGIPEALATLAQRGHPMGVCTSKRADFAEKILRLFGLRSNFAFVSGGDIGVSKEQQLGLLMANAAIDLDSTMIGDRAVDIQAAKFNGIASAGVLWGHGTHEELAGAGADRLLRNVEDLRSLGEHAA